MESAFYNTAAAATQHLCFKAASSVVMLFTRNGIEISVLNDIVYVAAIVVFEAVCGLFFGNKLRKESLKTTHTSSPTVLLLLIGMQLCTNWFQNLFDKYDVGYKPYTVFVMFDMICCLFLLMLQCEIVRNQKEQESNAIMQHLLYQQKQQMKLSQETIDLINVKCHDIKIR